MAEVRPTPGIAFAFTEEQELIRRTVRDFVDREVKPLAAEIDKSGRIPDSLMSRAKELGLFGMAFPEEYGGAGAGELGYCIQMEELAHGCNSLAGMIGASASITASTIWLAGSEAQKKRYLGALCSGEKIGAYALTETSGGTDAAMLRTTADRDGSDWVLNGDKVWITNADIAGVMVVFALTDRSLRARGGITAFIVDLPAKGVRIGPPDEKLGLHAMHSPQVWLENVRVPAENVIGQLGDGFKYAMMALDRGRLSLGANCIGQAKEMLNLSIAYANQRVAFGKPIAEHQIIQKYLAEMAAKIYAMESMVYRTAWMCDAGMRFSREAALVKFTCTEFVDEVIDTALQIHGGMGYMRELPIERFYRDTRVQRIFEGTNEIQRVIAARDLCKKGSY
jgi:alkylation response protein AidB-like acyl-CoA dehydrogenase